MHANIRPAESTDCPRILDLVKELAEYHEEPDAVTVSLAHFTESGFGKKPVWHAFVAEVEGIIVGFAMYYIRFSTWKGQRLYLEDLMVTRSLRGSGIGKQLFDRLIKEGKEKKLRGMVWQVHERNKPAIHFYKKYKAKLDPDWINGSIDW